MRTKAQGYINYINRSGFWDIQILGSSTTRKPTYMC